MLAKLKQLLAECHYTGGDLLKTLMEANYDYVMARASEEMELARRMGQSEGADDRIMLAIRLLNLARYKLCTPSNPSDTARPAPKRSSKKRSSPGSNGTTGT